MSSVDAYRARCDGCNISRQRRAAESVAPATAVRRGANWHVFSQTSLPKNGVHYPLAVVLSPTRTNDVGGAAGLRGDALVTESNRRVLSRRSMRVISILQELERISFPLNRALLRSRGLHVIGPSGSSAKIHGGYRWSVDES